MEAATLDHPEVAVSGPSSIIYLARRQNLILCHTPVRPIFGANGQKQGDTLGLRIEFQDGRFDCPLEGEYVAGNGFRIDAGELREWLTAHRLLDDAAEGFWKVDPAAPAPSTTELQTIVDLAMGLDLDGLEAMVKAEREGWQRQPVLDMASRAIEKVQVLLAEEAKAKAGESVDPPPAPSSEPKARGQRAPKPE